MESNDTNASRRCNVHPGTAARRMLLAVAIGAACGPAFAQDARVRTGGLQAEPVNRQFIVHYRADAAPLAATAASARTTARGQSMQRAAMSAGTTARVTRTLATGGDVVRMGKALDGVAAEAVMRAIAADPAVESVEVDGRRTTTQAAPFNDPHYALQWGYKHPFAGVNAPAVWPLTKGGGTVVAVLDTGRLSHPDLNARYVDGYDFISADHYPNDGNGRDGNATDAGDWASANLCSPGSPAENSSWHGTHVAGTVAASANNGIGGVGVAPGARVQPVRVLGRCGGWDSDISDAIVWASGGTVAGVPRNQTPAEVINMSLGGPGSCSVALQRAINGAIGRGTSVVVSAGNSNRPAAQFAPANCNGVITVGATGVTGARASYSNHGDRVDVFAPGGGDTDGRDYIWSTLNTGTRNAGSPSYAYYMGTSMAAPHVAGIVALLQSIRVQTPAQVRSLLRSTARPITIACTSCPDRMVDAEAAMSALRGRRYANNTARPITENVGQLRSVLDIDRDGNAGPNLRLRVSIRHPRPEDLIVSLQRPDGQYHQLHVREVSGTRGIHHTYTIDATGVPARGRWVLAYRDDVTGATGTLQQWSLMF